MRLPRSPTATLWRGGRFMVIGGVSINNIARWDGSGWSSLGAGTNGYVSAASKNAQR